MKKLYLLLLALAVMLAAAACDSTEPPVSEDESAAIESTDAVETTEAVAEVNPFVVPDTMDGIREKTIEYFNAMSAVKWVAPKKMDYTKSCPWTTILVYEKGRTYYGLPYSSDRPGVSLAEFEDYLNAQSVYTGPLEYKDLIGGDCGSMRRAWGWGGAICGFDMQSSFQMIPGHNRPDQKPYTMKVGTYDDSQYSDDTTTFDNTNKVNGPDVMYEAYSQLKPCDIIAHRFVLASNGKIGQHIRLITGDTVVVRLGNGNIAPSKSYIVFSEQTSTIREIDGKQTTWVLNDEMSFSELYQKGYMPLALVSMQKDKPDPVDMTASGFSKPENFATSPVLKGTIKCNYNIFEVELTITDKDGNTVSHAKTYPYSLQVYLSEIALSTPVKDLPAGDYHFTATATIGFGTKTVADFDFSK